MDENQKLNSDNAINNPQVRQHLVNTAANFLLNPDVKNKPDHSKTVFLRKKGLSDSEIAAAFEKVKLDPGNISAASQLGAQPAGVVPYTFYYPEKTVSFWSRLNRISTSLAVLAVALYGLHRFYKLYIEPWLFGTKPEEKNPMEELMMQLNNSICELKTAISTLELTVNSQKDRIDQILLTENSPYLPIPLAVAELKSEIVSMKSLFINRHQFPAVPKMHSPSIPLWQLPASESGNESKDGESSESMVENKSIASNSEIGDPKECDEPNSYQSSVTVLENSDTETITDTAIMDNDFSLSLKRQLPDSNSGNVESKAEEPFKGIASKIDQRKKCDEGDSNQSLKPLNINGAETISDKGIVAEDVQLSEKIKSIRQPGEPIVKEHIKNNGTHSEDESIIEDTFKDATQSYE